MFFELVVQHWSDLAERELPSSATRNYIMGRLKTKNVVTLKPVFLGVESFKVII